MTMTGSSSIDNIKGKFPYKHIPKIEGIPDYEALTSLKNMLYANAATLPTTLGGGKHGHMGLIMDPTVYATISSTPYVIPQNPGDPPKFDDGLSTLINSIGTALQHITS